MNVRFIDTSILTNLLNIPDKNEDREEVVKLFEQYRNTDTLILPLAAVIETGNHIAHISDGRIRRDRAERFSAMLLQTANNEAPWQFYAEGFSKTDFQAYAEHFLDFAVIEMGFGDMSIIHQYEQYKTTVPAIGHICIWSKDDHLAAYSD